MVNFNFDSEFFRKVICECALTEKIPSLSQMIKEATEAFYDEFDYYPDIGVSAPGVFTILGDHLEYVEGKLVQAALPFVTVIVGKSLNTVKCKIVTTAKHVDGLKKTTFPINYFNNKRVRIFPPWVTFLQGVISNFPCKNLKGFEALIHSSVPTNHGFGSSAALQVAFYAFLEATCGSTSCHNKEKRGLLCRKAELQYQPTSHKMGLWGNMTSSSVEGCSGALINCKESTVSTFHMKEIDILFLLTFPNNETESNDRDKIPRREMELQLIAKLLGLSHIKEATEKHLRIFEEMEDPERETVMEILRSIGISEDIIFEFVVELFNFPALTTLPEYSGEDDLLEIFSEFSGHEGSKKSNFQSDQEIMGEDQKYIEAVPCPHWPKERKKERTGPPLRSINFIDERLAQLCAGKVGSNKDLPVRICEEINCLGGIENLSVRSDFSVIGKLIRRLRYFIGERKRCADLPEIIYRGDYVEFGTLLIQSHLSLKLDFEVSCPTLDGLVQLAIDTDGVYGAKMMSGGGTITLLHRRVVEEFIKKIEENFGANFKFYLVLPNPGARILNIGVKSNPKSALSNKYLNKTELMKKAVQNFEITYKYRPSCGAYAPSIANFIGDHLDYNHGYVISMATSLLTVVVGAYNGTSKVRVVATDDVDEEPQKVIFSLPISEALTPGRIKWVKLIRGAIRHFGGELRGFDCLIENNLPRGSGICNHSSLVVAFYTFLEELTEQKTSDLCKKAHTCMLIQQDFGHISCGIGDSTISLRAREDYVLLLDCRSLATTLLPFQDTSVCLVMTFTGQKAVDARSLLFSRMEECYKVARALGAKTLRCLTLKSLEGLNGSKVSKTALKRAKHVVLENERVLRSAEALKNNDFESLGELMVASHTSLRYNYEVTTPELDFLVERAMEVDGVLGAKMHCNGVASCTLTLVKRWAVDDLIEYLKKNYSQMLNCYVVTPYAASDSLDLQDYLSTIPGPSFVFEDVFPF